MVVNASQHVLVAGAGAAGRSAATTLRQQRYAAPLVVVHGEAHSPYNRTLVNEAVLPGLLQPEQITLPSLESLGVRLVRATSAAVGDALAQRVVELHHERVTTHFGRRVIELRAGADRVTVTFDAGTRLESDLAVFAHVPERQDQLGAWTAAPAATWRT